MKVLYRSISFMVFLPLSKAAGAFLAGWLLIGVANAADDDYLNMLEAEASGQSVAIQQQSAGAVAPAASGDAYLNMLESEADEIEKKQPGQPEGAQTPRATSGGKKQLKTGLRFERFERKLKDRFFGVYFRYKKLSETDKKRVYEQYRVENSIERIRHHISHLDLEARRAQGRSQ